MSYWQFVTEASDAGRAFPWLVLAFLFLAFLLSVYDPSSRTRLRAAVLVLLVSVIGTFVAALVREYLDLATITGGHAPSPSFAYRCLRDASIVLRTVAIVTLLGVVVFDLFLPAVKLRPPAILRDILLAVAYIATSAIVLMNVETNLTGVVATSAVATGVIAFALQSTFENAMGGMALQMDRTINVGDWIRVDQFEGVVREIRWRQTSVETRDWNTVIIPNSMLMKSAVTVLGRRHGQPRQTRRWIYFQIDHGVPMNDVIHHVVSAIRDEPIPGVATDPPPNCIVKDLRDAWQTFAVRYWLTDLAHDDGTDTLVRGRVAAALRRANIGFSYPTQSILLHQIDEAHDQRQQARDAAQRLAAIARVNIFVTLTENEKTELADRLTVAPFTRGEVITRQGAQAHWLYMITQGQAEVRISTADDGLYRTVAHLHPGDFFGEMALLTGAARTATVVAATDVVCYRLDKDSFIDILHRRPAIAEGISHILAQRRVELDAAKDHLDIEAQRQQLKTAERDLLTKIRKFFTLTNNE